jgi:hypothetical protein
MAQIMKAFSLLSWIVDYKQPLSAAKTVCLRFIISAFEQLCQ